MYKNIICMQEKDENMSPHSVVYLISNYNLLNKAADF